MCHVVIMYIGDDGMGQKENYRHICMAAQLLGLFGEEESE